MPPSYKAYLGKGWRFPVDLDRTGGVSFSVFEDNIRDAIFIILGTAPGERIMRPTFGCDIHDLIFAPNNPNTCGLAAHYCEEALNKWEPRIAKVKARARPAPDEPNKILIEISYTIISNSTSRNLVYPFYLKTEEQLEKA
jgi:phage baseplate assembly protein W